MINLRNEKGSITLFVLISCMFLIASVACVQMYIQSKKIAVDREYRQIKSNYEGNSFNEDNLKASYEKISKLNNVDMNIVNTVYENNILSVEFKINDTDVNIESIKYGWGSNESVDTVNKWTFIENVNSNENMLALNNNAINSGEYHLFVVINKKVIYSKIIV